MTPPARLRILRTFNQKDLLGGVITPPYKEIPRMCYTIRGIFAVKSVSA